MKQAKVPLYIRFGDIPPDGISHVHFGDYDARPEGGLSVWEAVEANDCYYPVLPEDVNESGVADYFDQLLYGTGPVYLLTGDRIRMNGADNEPLLHRWTVLKEISHYYGRARKEEWKKREEQGKSVDIRLMSGDIYDNPPIHIKKEENDNGSGTDS
ncbi:MAG: hypothetical protein NC131_09940 [Roseburia sp.]|nr:hypothetical protein [Roseburia sp.]